MPTSVVRFCFLLLFAVCLAFAQDRGTITGTITDSSGAAVPSAALVLTNPATGISQKAASGPDGTYNFLYLPVGKYSLTVEQQGFQKASVPSIVVNVATTTRVDVPLQVGATQQTVEVQGAAPLLQADRSDLGRVVDNKAIQQLPLFANGGLRSNIAFTLLTPGVQGTITSDPDQTGGAPRVAGGDAYGNSMLVDGGEAMSERRNDPQMRLVSAEGIQEFRVQSGAYSAEYGRSSNGVFNYSTKSGTNALHGSLFAVNRNNALNAKGFFYGKAPSVPTVHNQNLQAASVGGPVYIPKVYDGRNKAFFFFSGERSRAKDVPTPGLISIAIQDFRNGDFRRYVNSSGNMVPLYDPFDANGNIIADASKRQRMQCNGVLNVICPERINPVAKAIHAKLPLPDMPDVVFSNTYSRVNGSRTPGENQGVYAWKGDFNATDKFRFNGMFSKQYFNGYPLVGPIPGPISEGFQEFGNFKYARFNTDYIARPTLLNHFTFGYNQRDLGEDSLAPDQAYRAATLLPGVSADKAPIYTKYQTEFGNFGSHVWTRSPGRTYNIKEQMTWLKGRHNMKFGFEWNRVNYQRIDCNNCTGIVNFSAGGTGNPSVSGTTGINYASFLLGLSSGATFNYGASINFVFRYYAWYLQDDIKLTPKLTLNLGLRYELPFTRNETRHQNSNLNPSLPNPGANGYLGAMEFAGSGTGRSGRDILQDTRKNGFGPRVGFAYQLNPKTVIRAGGSVMYDSNREDGNADSGIQGFGGNFSSPSNFLSTGISFQLKDGFLAPGISPLVEAARPVRIDPALANYVGPTYRKPENGKTGYFYDYNFTVEHSITPNTLARASFHANYGIKTRNSDNMTQLDPKYWAIYGTLLSAPVSDPRVIATGFTLPFPSFPQNLQLQQALRPFPQYSTFSGSALGGHRTFNALETSLEHRYSKGFYVSVAYTFSKLLESTGGANIYKQLTEKIISGGDRPHVLAIGHIWDVPIGKGRRFLPDLHPVANVIIGGWSASAVHRYQSGTPISVGSGQQMYGAGSARPSFVAGEVLKNPNWDHNDPASPYLNPKAFVQPANMTYGNVPANMPWVRQPAQFNEDVAVSKFFQLGKEERTLEFRASAFNFANRHLLGGLTTGVTSSTFGRFSSPQSNQPRNIEFSLRFAF